MMTETESLSLKTCCRVLGPQYPIAIVTHEGVDLSLYRKVMQDYGIIEDVEIFDASFFAGIFGYNRLMVSYGFYNRFSKYDYMLLYQLDALVFKNELADWCNKGYDYIGAPLFAPGHEGTFEYASVGNGGLSLRRVEAFKRALSHRFTWRELMSVHRPYNPYVIGRKKLLYATMLYLMNRNNHWRDKLLHYVDEDRFYSYTLQGTCVELNVPKADEAVYFAFDLYASFCYECTHKTLPFGCHSFSRQSYDSFYKELLVTNAGQSQCLL